MDAIVVINAGSSSIKFALYEVEEQAPADVFRGQVEGLGSNPRLSAWDRENNALIAKALPDSARHSDAMAEVLDWVESNDDEYRLIAAGHRVVHGADQFAEPTEINAQVLEALDALCPLAPLHQPHNLSAIRAVAQHRPQLRQVACFDTEFHQSQPEIARLFPLPKALTNEGIKRYGFHGLSYEYIAGRLPDVIGSAAKGRVLVAHLGNGASLCALNNGKSIATTMGFTALDGLMMGTRTGNIDPGVLLYLLDEKKMSSRDLANLLYHQSGLFGVSGIGQDMRTLLTSNEPRANLAVELYVYRIVRELGSLVAALGGLDALVFTAGIGEHAAPIRQRVCEQLGWLGVEFDVTANKMHGPIISTKSSRVTVAVIPTNEEEMIARHALRLIRR